MCDDILRFGRTLSKMAKDSKSFPEIYHSNVCTPSISAISIKCNLEQYTHMLFCLHAKFHVYSCNTAREKCCIVLSACGLYVSSCNTAREKCCVVLSACDLYVSSCNTAREKLLCCSLSMRVICQ